ncbi:hypothetical protein [Nonomuraea endophytica]|uniref:Uncharacterized protein n=1 Tax=Nonomuraea endophytica TaxID=714136 RepID=A0A7W8EKU3_9ACTN|nr:hypothetical protein [Nonomuraea endophytica]MBB5084625.1 hypothetical protein [Nonomuraea endophytica]
MSSKSRQSREQHEDNTEQRSRVETPKPFAKVRAASRGTTERTASGGALSRRLAKQSLPLRRGQRGGTTKS